MGKGEEVTITCDGKSFTQGPPGDFASDAQFFVFTGVISFLATMAILGLYVFASALYDKEDKKAPLIVMPVSCFNALFF